MRVMILAIGILSLAACSETATEPNVPEVAQQAPAGQEEPLQPFRLADADTERVCRAALDVANGQDADAMKLARIKDGIARLSYVRASDGKRWTYDCRPNRTTISVRPVDEFGPGSGPSSWWANLTFHYDLRADSVHIQFYNFGEMVADEVIPI